MGLSYAALVRGATSLRLPAAGAAQADPVAPLYITGDALAWLDALAEATAAVQATSNDTSGAYVSALGSPSPAARARARCDERSQPEPRALTLCDRPLSRCTAVQHGVPVILLSGTVQVASVFSPPRISPLAGWLLLAGPSWDEPHSKPVEALLDLGGASDLLRLEQGASLFIQNMVRAEAAAVPQRGTPRTPASMSRVPLAWRLVANRQVISGLGQGPPPNLTAPAPAGNSSSGSGSAAVGAPLPATTTVLPMTAFPLAPSPGAGALLAAAPAVVWMANVTLVLPLDDYLALVLLALNGTETGIGACASDAVRAGVRGRPAAGGRVGWRRALAGAPLTRCAWGRPAAGGKVGLHSSSPALH